MTNRQQPTVAWGIVPLLTVGFWIVGTEVGDYYITTVCLPDSCRKFVSRASFVKCMVLFVVVFSVLYNVPHCFEAVVLECWHSHFESRSLEVCPDPFRFLPSYMLIYYKYMYSIFLAVGPLVVLVVLNLCIIIASVILKKGGGSSGDTIALVLVVLLFIACNIAALLLNVFEARLGELLGPHINYIVDASNVLVVFNSSFNFIIYVTFSLPFRRTLQQYVCKRTRVTKPIPHTNIKNPTIETNYSCYYSGSSSHSTGVNTANDNIVNHNQHHHHQRLQLNGQSPRKVNISRLLKAVQPEVLI